MIDIVTPYHDRDNDNNSNLIRFIDDINSQTVPCRLIVIDDSPTELPESTKSNIGLYVKLAYRDRKSRWSEKFNISHNLVNSDNVAVLSCDWTLEPTSIQSHVEILNQLDDALLCVHTSNPVNKMYNQTSFARYPRYDYADNGMGWFMHKSLWLKYSWDEQFDLHGNWHQIPFWLRSMWRDGIKFYQAPEFGMFHPIRNHTELENNESNESGKYYLSRINREAN